MNLHNWMKTLTPLALAIGLLGCTAGKDDYKPLTDSTELEHMEEAHDHGHEGPHGGHILELGPYHGEITMGENRQIKIYILGGDVKTAQPVKDGQITLMLEGAEPISLTAAPAEGETDGMSSVFVTPDGSVPEAFKDIEAVHGSVKLAVEGNEATAAIEHDHDHGHAH